MSDVEVYLEDGRKSLISELKINDVVEVTLHGKEGIEKSILPCVIVANEWALPQNLLVVKCPGNCANRLISISEIKRISILEAIHVFDSYDFFIRLMEKRIQELSRSVQ